ncbi:MAG: response regulator [Bacteroidota bacterium]
MQNNTIKCLLIDDDVDDQEVFKMAVASLDIAVEVATANGGSQAFEILNRNELPDCIFLDLNMPLMNGREFLKKIKNIDRLKEIPVLIYSTSTDAKDKTDMIFLGAAQFIIKPNSMNDLIVILKKELARVSAMK